MDAYTYPPYHQEIVLSTPKSKTKSIPSASISPDQLQIVVKFSCKPKYRTWILPEGSTELELLENIESPLVTKSFQFNMERTLIHKLKTFDALCEGFIDFPLSIEKRAELANFAVETAWDIIMKSMRRGRNHLKLDFKLIVVHKHVFDENRAVRRMMLRQDKVLMASATDASIESLEKKKAEDDGDCPICLEDLEAGCEVTSMPCSHVFHGDCIKNWLRISHYCPICRFKMPTSS